MNSRGGAGVSAGSTVNQQRSGKTTAEQRATYPS